MDLNITNYGVVEILGIEIWITETLVNTWLISGLLIIFAIIVRIALKNFKPVPGGFQNAVEAIVETFDNFSVGALGEKLNYISPWYFTVFLYILLSALGSIFGFRAPTADFSTTFALAFATFVLMIVMGFKHKKDNYLKSFFQPYVVFFPINIMGELAKPVSLSFRLFGNMLSGTILLSLYY
ncbi:MAG: F0F1 ATP synthase subunit A, partial [Clostridiaceae bacterium]|nr:F0F1 ATP synthase subunit A [Clostridiaceae bacterium]